MCVTGVTGAKPFVCVTGVKPVVYVADVKPAVWSRCDLCLNLLCV